MAGKKDVTAYKRPHKLKYGKWGLIFILPFFICYGIFQLYPLIATFYRSFFHDKTEHLPATYLGKNSQSISPPIVREKKTRA